MKSLAYMSLVRPIPEYGFSCWDSYSEGQINATCRVQKKKKKKKPAKFANRTNYSVWETLAKRKKIARICALFEAHTGERTWKSIGDSLQNHAA